jgi:alginate O-acetyltransferase complex protein AlgI
MFTLVQSYFLFILVTFLVFNSISQKYKPLALLIASIVFIGAISLQFATYAIIFASVNYLFGIILFNRPLNSESRTWLFRLFILIDIIPILFFKYIPILSPLSSIIIPFGISYYTFQALGYLIRIDRGVEKPETNFINYALFLLFFPKFISGPIERSNHFLPQLKNIPFFKKELFQQGLRLFLWGLFKKVVIADNLFQPLKIVYDNVYDYNGLQLWLIMLVQTAYIYNDFSGYTDMALGTAKIFGIDLIDNFNRPFLAKNISDYWRRWHISLSSWCNDFIYNPFIIKYRKWGIKAATVGVIITFLIVGIWHGANATYIILGLLQAIAIIYENFTKRWRFKLFEQVNNILVNTISRVLVYLFMSVSMIFFFAHSIADAVYFIYHLFSNVHSNNSTFYFIKFKPEFILALFLFIGSLFLEYFIEKGLKINELFFKQNIILRYSFYLIALLLIYISIDKSESFYYARF